MSLPEERIPPEAVATGAPGKPQAYASEMAPVWDVTGTRWSWVHEEGGFICDDPTYLGPVATTPGAIPVDRQPFYAHPPSDLQIDAAQRHPESGG